MNLTYYNNNIIIIYYTRAQNSGNNNPPNNNPTLNPTIPLHILDISLLLLLKSPGRGVTW